MSLMKRLSTTVMSHVESSIARIENHEAVIDAALHDVRRLAAQARVRLARLQKDGAALQSRDQSLRDEIATWASRATQVAGTDRDKALDCLRRRQACQQALQESEQALALHRQNERALHERVADIERRVATLTRQRNEFRTRAATAEAQRAIDAMQAGGTGSIDERFDRWEISMADGNAMGSAPEDSALKSFALENRDTFEESFRTAENDAVLRDELDALLLENNTGTIRSTTS